MTKTKLIALLMALAASFSQAVAQPGVAAYRVFSPGGKPNILIGTVHVPHAALRQPSASVLDGARSFVIEHTTDDEVLDGMDPESFAGMLQGRNVRAPWARSLTEQQIKLIVDRYNCSAIKPLTVAEFETILQMRTAQLAAKLALVPCAPKGMQSRDDLLAAGAKERGIPVVALETQQEVGARRARIPPRFHEATLHNGVNVNLDKVYEDLTLAANRGDFDEIERLAGDGVGDEADRKLFKQIMLTERNVAWLPSLRTALDKGQAVVAVGAGHLGGKQGLLALLARDGYRAEPIILPATP